MLRVDLRRGALVAVDLHPGGIAQDPGLGREAAVLVQNRHVGQLRAVQEGVLADPGHTARDHRAGQMSAPEKRVGSDAGDAVFQVHRPDRVREVVPGRILHIPIPHITGAGDGQRAGVQIQRPVQVRAACSGILDPDKFVSALRRKGLCRGALIAVNRGLGRVAQIVAVEIKLAVLIQDRHPGQIVALIESRGFHAGHAGRDRNLGQPLAAPEAGVADPGHAAGDRQVLQAVAAAESSVADVGQAIGKGQILQAVAAVKRVHADGLHCVREAHAFDVFTEAEGLVAHMGDAWRKDHMLDIFRVVPPGGDPVLGHILHPSGPADGQLAGGDFQRPGQPVAAGAAGIDELLELIAVLFGIGFRRGVLVAVDLCGFRLAQGVPLAVDDAVLVQNIHGIHDAAIGKGGLADAGCAEGDRDAVDAAVIEGLLANADETVRKGHLTELPAVEEGGGADAGHGVRDLHFGQLFTAAEGAAADARHAVLDYHGPDVLGILAPGSRAGIRGVPAHGPVPHFSGAGNVQLAVGDSDVPAQIVSALPGVVRRPDRQRNLRQTGKDHCQGQKQAQPFFRCFHLDLSFFDFG